MGTDHPFFKCKLAVKLQGGYPIQQPPNLSEIQSTDKFPLSMGRLSLVSQPVAVSSTVPATSATRNKNTPRCSMDALSFSQEAFNRPTRKKQKDAF